MMRARLSLLVLPLLLTAAVAGDPPGAYFKNGAWGYKVRVPKSWIRASLSVDEEWIASKHLGKRELEDPRANMWVREAPEMWVIGFPHVRKDRAAKRSNKGTHSDVQIEVPYTGYKDFIKRNRTFLSWEGGGYFFSKEKETEIGGVKVTQYEVKMEKQVSAPRRVVCWVYHFDDIDFAVQFKVLERFYDDYKGSFRTCLKSFKRAERTKAIPGAASTGKKIVDVVDIDKLPPAERKKALKDAVERKFQREIDGLPKDWKHKRSKNFLVLYNAPDKFVRATITHAEAVRAHIEKLFGGMGNQYVPPGIIRMFASETERSAYTSSTRSIWDIVKEVTVVAGHGWEKDWAYGSLNQSIFDQYLHYRNRLLRSNMPTWLSAGLGKYFDMVRSKGKRIKFSNEDWTRDSMRLSIKKGEIVQLKELVSSGIWNAEGGQQWNKYEQARSVVYWLMRDGNRGKYKGLIKKYMDHLTGAVEDAEAEYRRKKGELDAKRDEAKGDEKRSMDEDDEDEEKDDGYDASQYWEDLSKAMEDKRKEILETSFKRAFGDWTESDWKRFHNAWVSVAK